ncbi:unnamed protein product [Symbiodinium necroappetens]|uniref:Uncharacterized protein n=1 Tax=Symbiodinium necroappetens TaxID=1628268 RepID=A0A812ZE76_9DINO|nr:unnamed protein product [Symbiodinium necroappetens]
MAGRRGPRSGGEEDLKYRGLDDKVDEGPWREGPLIVAWGAEEIYKTTQKSGAIGNPLCVYGAWKAARDQEEFPAAFVMLCGILDTLLHVEGRSVLQIICSHGRNRSATLGVALSAVYDIPIWLPTFGDLHTEWWAIARLPDEDIEDLKDMVAVLRPRKGPFNHMGGAPGRPGSSSGQDAGPGDVGPGAGPAPNQVHVEADYGFGRYDPSQLEAYMPSLGNPVVDAVRFDVWKVAPSVLLELDGLGVDNAVANMAGHSEDGARFVRELFQVFQRENDADLRTYRNPSAAITSACRKEMDRLRPEVPASQGRSDGGGGCRSDVPHPRQPPRPTYDDYDARRAEPRGGAFYEDRREAVCHRPLSGYRRDEPMDFRDRGPHEAWANYRPEFRDREYYDRRDDRRDDRRGIYYDDRDRLSDPGHPGRPPPRWVDENLAVLGTTIAARTFAVRPPVP